MPTNWLKPMSAGTVVDGPLSGGAFQDWLATQANTGLPQKPEDAQKLWERYMDETGKAPAGFGGGKVPLPDTSKEGILASSLAKMQDVLQKYNDPRWKKFIDAAGINIDKVKAFVDANSGVGPVIDDPHDERFIHKLPDATGLIPAEGNGPRNQSIYPPPNVGGLEPNQGFLDAVGKQNDQSVYRPPQPYKGVDRGVIPQLGAPDAGTVTTPGTMPNVTHPMPNAPKIGRGIDRPLGNNPLDVGSILPNQGTNRGYKPNRRRYF